MSTTTNNEQGGSVGLKRGQVKQVLSGDALVLQGPPVNGPPKEVTVYLSSVTAPRLARRPTEESSGSVDEPFAWASREYLRQRLIGQTVSFVRDYTATSGREHGRVYLGGSSPENAENLTESAVAAGWLEVRQGSGKTIDEYTQKLLDLQSEAKTAHRGKWMEDAEAVRQGVRDITWVVADPRRLVDSLKQKPQKAVIEQVRDASTVRAFLLPGFQYITVVLSGVKAPALRSGTEGRAEEFSEEAKYFAECRLLQRDVEIVLEGVSNQNFVGSVLHPKGNIAELLLREGFAKCVDWSISLATGGPEPLRAAERAAKEKRLRVWRAYQPSQSAHLGDKKSFQAKVIEIVMADALVIKKDNGEEQKIFLSSIRQPKLEEGKENQQSAGRQFRPLYDIPYMFEAREFLRKRLIGKKVQVTIDYIQPKSDQFAEKLACTVMAGGINIAEALVSKGLAKVIRYRGDDDNRSSHYDALLAAEAKAEKSKKGIHTDREVGEKGSVLRIQELQGDVNRSKQFLPSLQRVGRCEGVVEFVASGSRVRLYLPRETCLITFLLSGITCPRGSRAGPGGKPTGESEPFADEAIAFTRSKALQHEVEIEVDGLDKTGNFIGYLFVPSGEQGGTMQNLSELLVEAGLASVHFTAERSKHYNHLIAAEKRAKQSRLCIWKDWQEPTIDQIEISTDNSDRSINYKKVVVTNVHADNLHFAAQNYEEGSKLEKMTGELRSELSSNVIMGTFSPRRGELCAARFSADNEWYRARVESLRGGKVDVLYIDYGNRETTDTTKLAALPSPFLSIPPAAKEYALALVQIPSDPDYATGAYDAMQQLVFSSSSPFLLLNTEYRIGGVEHVTLMDVEKNGDEEKKKDIGKTLLAQGFVVLEHRRDKRLSNLMEEYMEAEKEARRDHLNIWQYGDFTGSEL